VGSSDQFTKVRGATLVGISLIFWYKSISERALIRSVMLELCRKIQFKDIYDSTENSEMSATPCSIHETVQSTFAVNDFAVLQDCCTDLGREENRR
jgi:hypothetical protein